MKTLFCLGICSRYSRQPEGPLRPSSSGAKNLAPHIGRLTTISPPKFTHSLRLSAEETGSILKVPGYL